MANESEGILDVLREWRDMVCYSKGPVHPLCHGAIMNNLDRIEAAWTREREALEAHVRSLQSQLKVAYSCGEQPQGNAAAIRETLCALQARFEKNVMAYQDRYFKFTYWHWRKKAKEAEKWRDIFSELNDQCKAALAKPQRNCDVGTAEEQCARWRKFCDSHSERISDTSFVCNCPCKGCGIGECELEWAQMPYTEGGAR